MPNKKKRQWKRFIERAAVAVLAVVASFSLGVHSAGDIDPIGSTQANVGIRGDLNSDGRIDLSDVDIALEIAAGYREATTQELLADPDEDLAITVKDARTILESIPH